jgi:hypothetical protein
MAGDADRRDADLTIGAPSPFPCEARSVPLAAYLRSRDQHADQHSGDEASRTGSDGCRESGLGSRLRRLSACLRCGLDRHALFQALQALLHLVTCHSKPLLV